MAGRSYKVRAVVSYYADKSHHENRLRRKSVQKLYVEHGDENIMTTLKLSYYEEKNGKRREYQLQGNSLEKVVEKYVKVGLIRRRDGVWYVRNDRGRYQEIGNHITTDYWGGYCFGWSNTLEKDACIKYFNEKYKARMIWSKPELLGSSYEKHWWPRTVKVYGSAGHYWLKDCKGNYKKVSFFEAVDTVRSEGRICSDGTPVWRGRKLWRGGKDTYKTVTIQAGMSKRRLVVNDLARGRVRLDLEKVEAAYDKCGFYPQWVTIYPDGVVYLEGEGNHGLLAYT